MNGNFWTEENKIMTLNGLIRADMRNKLLAMGNQVMYGREVADNCYNYDFLINDEKKAVQFIADYADDFISRIQQYEKTTGKSFRDIKNPLKVVNLMALYEGRDIIKQCPTLQANWDKKIALKSDTLSTIVREVMGPELPDKERFSDKVNLSKETLSRVGREGLQNYLSSLIGQNITLEKAGAQLKEPVIGEAVAKSILKNSYKDVIRTLNRVGFEGKDFCELISRAVFAKMQENQQKICSTLDKNSVITEQVVEASKIAMNMNKRREVYLPPKTEKDDLAKQVKQAMKQKAAREKEALTRKEPTKEK